MMVPVATMTVAHVATTATEWLSPRCAATAALVLPHVCCLVLERGEVNLQEYLKKAGRRLDNLKKKNILSDMFQGLSAMHRGSGEWNNGPWL